MVTGVETFDAVGLWRPPKLDPWILTPLLFWKGEEWRFVGKGLIVKGRFQGIKVRATDDDI